MKSLFKNHSIGIGLILCMLFSLLPVNEAYARNKDDIRGELLLSVYYAKKNVLPQTVNLGGTTVTWTDVTFENDVYTYYYKLDAINNKDTAMLKNYLINNLLSNSNTIAFVKSIIDLKGKIVYSYFTPSGDTLNITFTTPELKEYLKKK